jgi:hypothetical protein
MGNDETMGKQWGDDREMTRREDGHQGNDEQDGTTTNGHHSCLMPTPHSHPQAHSHSRKMHNKGLEP